MSSPSTVATADIGTTERLAAALNRCFETLEPPTDVFADDLFCDLLPPFWRFQIEGPDAFVEQLRAIANGSITSRVVRVITTSEGFVLEHEETQSGPPAETARRVWICRVAGDRITDITCYCNGGWDDALRARHAAEAPMLRW